MTIRKVTNRFKEPSTWAAFGAMGAVFGVRELAVLGVPETATMLASLTAMLAAVFLPEKDRGE